MKKRFLLLIVCASLVSTIWSQDIIVTKDARNIEAKVMEINIDNIKYKLSANPEGPIYTMLKKASHNDKRIYLTLGYLGCVVGEAFIIAGIPQMAVGGAKKKQVQDEFEKKYLSTTNPQGSFQIQLSNNGMGLAYVF
ncbi:hypothetical protein FACS189434_03970 [Bacteroidia bacterium]|nr:hypothetical protein FACS189434_03970 [Bacteroidia bacterium]